MTRTHLLFIPGLGDRTWLYRLAMPLWRALGYEPHIFCFEWRGSAGMLTEKQQQLVRYVDDLGTIGLCVIGVSAGGTAAVSLLAERPELHKVVTVASPLIPKDRPTSELLTAAIKAADIFLSGAAPDARRKVVSVHAMLDWRVPVTKSQRRGLRSFCLPTIGHELTILLALSLYAGRLRTLLR